MEIVDKLHDLGIFDQKCASLILFEVATQIKREQPFSSQDEANVRLKMLLFGLKNFEIKNESNRKFLDNLVDVLKTKVYESEAFDEHLDF